MMKKSSIYTITKTIAFTAFATVLSLSVVHAKPSGERGQKGPPPEAFEACENMQEGDSVTFENPRGDQMTAECKLIDEQLVAVPEGHEGRRQ